MQKEVQHQVLTSPFSNTQNRRKLKSTQQNYLPVQQLQQTMIADQTQLATTETAQVP